MPYRSDGTRLSPRAARVHSVEVADSSRRETGPRTARGRVCAGLARPDWLLLGGAYLVGGVPFALLLARRVGGVDVRSADSGNLDAANVLRTTRPALACAVLALDVGKGAAVVLFSVGVGAHDVVQVATAVAVVAGHVWSFWLRFRGGKGVATACGAFAVLAPDAAAVAAAVFVVVVSITRYVSVASVVATLTLPVAMYGTSAPSVTVASAAGIAAVVVSRHRGNLVRLQFGTERRVALRERS